MDDAQEAIPSLDLEYLIFPWLHFSLILITVNSYGLIHNREGKQGEGAAPFLFKVGRQDFNYYKVDTQ